MSTCLCHSSAKTSRSRTGERWQQSGYTHEGLDWSVGELQLQRRLVHLQRTVGSPLQAQIANQLQSPAETKFRGCVCVFGEGGGEHACLDLANMLTSTQVVFQLWCREGEGGIAGGGGGLRPPWDGRGGFGFRQALRVHVTEKRPAVRPLCCAGLA
jgi:hypothetical protein